MAQPAMSAPSAKDLRSHAGQLLIMGLDGPSVDSKAGTVLKTIRPGGVTLFARNIESPRQTWMLLRDCRRYSPLPMFLSLDMEGGTVDRLRQAISPTPSAGKVFATGDPRLFRRHGQVIGEQVRALGFNTDFAPVLDLGLKASRSVLGSRAVSPDATLVIGYAREFLRGLKSAGIVGCGKHFPGLGAGRLDSHKSLPVIRKTWNKLWTEDLLPYRELVRRLPLVMVAHAHYPAVTRDRRPASLSPRWMEILRNEIHYRGLVVSDDLEMGGALAAGSIGEVAVATLRAGADLYLVCRQDPAFAAYEAVVREAEKDRLFAAHLRAAARRVRRFQRRHFGPQEFADRPTAATVTALQNAMWRFSREVDEQTGARTA